VTVQRGRRWPLILVRTLAVVLLVQVLLQATLAGGFVSGNVGLLDVHSINGNVVPLTAFALIVAAVLVWRPGRGPKWPILAMVGVWLLAVTQVGLGFARILGGHFPLGVLLFGAATALTWWSFSYRPQWTEA
jgi:hypothetical protein